MRGISIIDRLALALVVIGALNWGLIGIFGFNRVSWIFGSVTVLSRLVYILVGLGGIWSLSLLFRPDPEPGAQMG